MSVMRGVAMFFLASRDVAVMIPQDAAAENGMKVTDRTGVATTYVVA
jgi:hypothetical protein